MFILPHSTALDLDGHAYATYAIVILCAIIYFFQAENNLSLSNSISHYCQKIHNPALNDKSLDLMRADTVDCQRMLSLYVYDNEALIPDRLQKIKFFNFSIFDTQMDEVLRLMANHFKTFQKNAVESLDAKLMYYPDSWNPITMISSSLSHGSFSHILFNLIFFLAFTPALELLIANTFKFLGILLAITFTTGISYSVASYADSNALPTLGLSGIVMGMIGLSAYLMPKAKIRVFFWFFTFVRNFYISAWILAIWYIGWDAWDLLNSGNHGGINLVSHVSGGISGYLIGYFWLKKTREDTRDELDDEIEYQRSKRADRHTMPGISFSGNRKYLESKQWEKQASKDNSEYMSRLYQYVNSRNDSDAIVLMLDDYDLHHVQVEIYEELFQSMSEWQPSRTMLCMGRTCISLLLKKKNYKQALIILKQCQATTHEFVLADPTEVLLMTRAMIDLQEYETAYLLIHNAGERYGEYIDATQCQLQEVRLLWHDLDKEEEAAQLINSLLINVPASYKKEILDLAKNMRGLN